MHLLPPHPLNLLVAGAAVPPWLWPTQSLECRAHRPQVTTNCKHGRCRRRAVNIITQQSSLVSCVITYSYYCCCCRLGYLVIVTAMLVADGQERVDRVEGAASVAIGRWIGAWIAKHTPGKRWWVAVCTITISIRCCCCLVGKFR